MTTRVTVHPAGHPVTVMVVSSDPSRAASIYYLEPGQPPADYWLHGDRVLTAHECAPSLSPAAADQPSGLEAAIAAQPGERVTKEQIEARIKEVLYCAIGATVTVCSIFLDNGFLVRGACAYVDSANYDPSIGRRNAYNNAFRKLRPLFGLMLAEARFQRARNEFWPVRAPAALSLYTVHTPGGDRCVLADAPMLQPFFTNTPPEAERPGAADAIQPPREAGSGEAAV